MTDFTAGGSVPPLIPGDATFRDVVSNNRVDVRNKLVLPKIANTSSVLMPSDGLLVYNMSNNTINFYGSGTWTAL